MAEVANNNNEQPRKGRSASKTPRIDMTPMVDLAFMLLTFFVLTSSLHKPKTMEITMPTSEEPPMPLYEGIANTILIDGSGKIYYYSGMLNPDEGLTELSLNPESGLRKTITTANASIQEHMKYVQDVYTSGKFTQENYARVEQYVRLSTASRDNDPEAIKNLKSENYSACITLMDRDLTAGTMSDDTYKKVGAALRGSDNAPFFVVKWGGNAKYGEVINVIDELKIGYVAKYCVAPISTTEFAALSNETGINYPELNK